MHNENSTQRMSMSSQPPAEIEEEFCLLMSMALDELLDSDEQADFDSYLATYPTLAEEWQDWQALDIQLSSTPSVAPPTEFMLNFEVRLLQHERRRRLWWGMAFGSMAVVLWVAVLVGVASLGAFVLFGQPAWLTQAVHSLAYVSASFGTWVTAVGTAFGSVMSTQQAASLAMVYMLMSIAMVASWIYFLRHSTRSVDVAASA
jgi:anti-sigma factor RsiW